MVITSKLNHADQKFWGALFSGQAIEPSNSPLNVVHIFASTCFDMLRLKYFTFMVMRLHQPITSYNLILAVTSTKAIMEVPLIQIWFPSHLHQLPSLSHGTPWFFHVLLVVDLGIFQHHAQGASHRLRLGPNPSIALSHPKSTDQRKILWLKQ